MEAHSIMPWCFWNVVNRLGSKQLNPHADSNPRDDRKQLMWNRYHSASRNLLVSVFTNKRDLGVCVQQFGVDAWFAAS